MLLPPQKKYSCKEICIERPSTSRASMIECTSRSNEQLFLRPHTEGQKSGVNLASDSTAFARSTFPILRSSGSRCEFASVCENKWDGGVGKRKEEGGESEVGEIDGASSGTEREEGALGLGIERVVEIPEGELGKSGR